MPQPLTFRVNDAASLGAAVREFRAARHLSQAQLAEAMGVHRSYLSELERGRVTEQLARLLEAFHQLGVDVLLVAEGS
ncbi:MAG TPA: helix-turn-helix transcriptional regulator [Acidimicrobiales bacterium]|nr:helix-turn-helix transcriptional regulator [Acidimicrobiales bacterium]